MAPTPGLLEFDERVLAYEIVLCAHRDPSSHIWTPPRLYSQINLPLLHILYPFGARSTLYNYIADMRSEMSLNQVPPLQRNLVKHYRLAEDLLRAHANFRGVARHVKNEVRRRFYPNMRQIEFDLKVEIMLEHIFAGNTEFNRIHPAVTAANRLPV